MHIPLCAFGALENSPHQYKAVDWEGDGAMDKSDEENARDGEDEFWGELAIRLLHSTQVEVIEAMRWIDEPVSPSQLGKVLRDSEMPAERKARNRTVASFAYHVKRLVELRVLHFHSMRPARGVTETFYIFDWNPRDDRQTTQRDH